MGGLLPLASLIIYEDSDQTETIFESFELKDTSILIGSDPDSHLILETPEVDSNHASLELRDGHWILQDLGGPGGTFVNGEMIDGPFALYHGDLIELSHVKLKFHDPERGVTKEFPRPKVAKNGTANDPDVHIRGRIWFAALAGGTVAIIVMVLVLLLAAHFLGIVSISDLLPPWLAG